MFDGLAGGCSGLRASLHGRLRPGEDGCAVTGTVKEFKWANPHSWIEMEVPDAKGAVTIWNVEMTSPAVLIRAGWKSSVMKPGDKVTVNCHPQITGEPGCIFVSVTLGDGRTLTDRPASGAPAPPAPAPAETPSAK